MPSWRHYAAEPSTCPLDLRSIDPSFSHIVAAVPVQVQTWNSKTGVQYISPEL